MADNTPKHFELLYEAALRGDESLLQDLLVRDPFLLHRPLLPTSSTPPLHAACKIGHTNFVLLVLQRNPNLAEELDPNDKSSLLHLAAKSGRLEIVKFLISINPDLCYRRDMHGRNPVHVAAINGQVIVLEELLKSTPAAGRERVLSSLDTVMHLCVKFNQLKALMRTVRMIGYAQMMNATDVDGNTVLHVAVANKHLEIVEFLLRDKSLKKNSQNSIGLTAMDVFKEIPHDVVDARLRLALKREKVSPSKHNLKESLKEKYSKWIEDQRNTLMIVASLIATMAFQAAVNPPGGVWQDDKDEHFAGTPVLATKHQKDYDRFFKWNTAGFVLSMGSILILISGLPFKRFVMVLIKVTMWFVVAVMASTYVFSSVLLLDDHYHGVSETEASVIINFAVSWIGVMELLFIGHLILWPVKFIKYLCTRRRPQNT